MTTQERVTRRFSFSLLIAALLMLVSFSKAIAEPVKVATVMCPPFVMEKNGKLDGVSVFLWEQIADQLNIDYQLDPKKTMKGMLEHVAQGQDAIGISCPSITPEREELVDFSHSYYETNLAIAVKQQGFLGVLKGILTDAKLLIAVGIVLLGAAIVGGILFSLEHRVNDKLYAMKTLPSRMVEGFILGLLFIVKGPVHYYEFKTLTARVMAAVFAVFSTFFIASITAGLATVLTIDHLRSQIKGPQDLTKVEVGAVADSTSSRYLEGKKIAYHAYEDLETMLADLENGTIAAAIGDGALLKYTLKHETQPGQYKKLSVLPYQFERQNYGVALSEDNPLLESINRALLKVRNSPEWEQKLQDYFR
ncbi:transporter substrate-binding domain-containing protein [Spongorhabdus nitratireducens]